MAMRTFHFTNPTLSTLPPCPLESRSRAIEYSDLGMPWLKALVSRTRQIVFYHRYIFNGLKIADRIGSYPGISIAEARQKTLENRAILDRGGNPQEARARLKAMPTLEQFAENEYSPFIRQYKRSANSDESKLALYLIPHFGNRRLCDITLHAIQLYLAGLRKTLAPSTVNRHAALLSKMFSLALQWERVDKNPCKGLQKLKENNLQQRFLTDDEIGRLAQVMPMEKNQTAANVVMILLLTGTRREEALKARWEHIDLAGGIWLLPDTKSGNPRYVQLSEPAIDLLKGIPRIDSPFVFPGRDPSKPLNNPRKAFTRLLNAAGIEHIRLHDLRHTHASILVNQGESLFVVQQVLGHASPKTTQRYSHLSNSTLKAASASVGEVVNRARDAAAKKQTPPSAL